MSGRFQVNPLVIDAATREVDGDGFRCRLDKWLSQQRMLAAFKGFFRF